jgi:hypothetical protein
MNGKLTFVVISLVAIFAFIAGKYSAESEHYSDQLTAIFTATDLAYDRWGDVVLLDHLYEQVEEDPVEAKKQFILAISLIYRENGSVNDETDSERLLNTSIYKTNIAVENFLKRHGFAKCKSLKESKLVACNLSAVEDDV